VDSCGLYAGHNLHVNKRRNWRVDTRQASSSYLVLRSGGNARGGCESAEVHGRQVGRPRNGAESVVALSAAGAFPKSHYVRCIFLVMAVQF
jgi:hypothetical protein